MSCSGFLDMQKEHYYLLSCEVCEGSMKFGGGAEGMEKMQNRIRDVWQWVTGLEESGAFWSGHICSLSSIEDSESTGRTLNVFL